MVCMNNFVKRLLQLTLVALLAGCGRKVANSGSITAKSPISGVAGFELGTKLDPALEVTRVGKDRLFSYMKVPFTNVPPFSNITVYVTSDRSICSIALTYFGRTDRDTTQPIIQTLDDKYGIASED